MRFDDRLSTVLSQPVGSPHDRIVRWRQLVDLVARASDQGDPELLAKALQSIRTERRHVREPLRAAAARAIAGKPIPLGLLKIFADDKLAVAAPLLAAATIDEDVFADLRVEASDEVRGFLDTLRPVPEPAVADPSVPTISDVVARIERLRSERALAVEDEGSPLPPPREPEAMPPAFSAGVEVSVRPDPPAGRPQAKTRARKAASDAAIFRWECNPSGEIDWVEGAPRGPLIGRSIAGADPDEGVDACVERAFKTRAPFRDCSLELADGGELAGSWTISGAPAFAPGDGRFVGYRGIARRGLPQAAARSPSADAPSASYDSVREMIHEIKTPLNAIIGFAEIIDGQYFGPAHRRYRQRAAQIVTNARLLLLAAEDLDFVARLRSGTVGDQAPAWVSDVASAVGEKMVARAVRQGVLIDLDDDIPGGGGARINADLVDRLALRLADALASVATPGERLAATTTAGDGSFCLSIARPRVLATEPGERMLDPEFSVAGGDDTALPIGFSLRLINGLAGLAGGRLDFDPRSIVLILPTTAD